MEGEGAVDTALLLLCDWWLLGRVTPLQVWPN